MHNSLVKIVWIITYIIFWPVIRLVWNVRRTIAPEIFEAKKPLILVANHRSIFDPWIVCINLPFKTFLNLLPIRILAVDEFSYPLSRILKALGIVSLVYFLFGVRVFRKEWSFEEKLAPLATALVDGETAMIFPEGSIQFGPDLGPFKKGAAYLAEKTYRPLLPVSVRFDQAGMGRTICRLNYGPPFMMPPEFDPNNQDDQKLAGDYLRNTIRNLYKN